MSYPRLASPLDIREIADMRLGVAIGKVDSAYELYAGGLQIGGVGSLPPTPQMDYDRHGIYPVPYSAIDAERRLVLALRVWKAPATRSSVGGPHEGSFLLGAVEGLTRRELLSELPSVFLAGWFLLLGLVHFELFRRRKEASGYLWFALLCLAFGVYAWLRTQWKYLLSDNFLLLKEIEHVDLYFGLVVFIQFVWPLIHTPIGRMLRGVQIGRSSARHRRSLAWIAAQHLAVALLAADHPLGDLRLCLDGVSRSLEWPPRGSGGGGWSRGGGARLRL